MAGYPPPFGLDAGGMPAMYAPAAYLPGGLLAVPPMATGVGPPVAAPAAVAAGAGAAGGAAMLVPAPPPPAAPITGQPTAAAAAAAAGAGAAAGTATAAAGAGSAAATAPARRRRRAPRPPQPPAPSQRDRFLHHLALLIDWEAWLGPAAGQIVAAAAASSDPKTTAVEAVAVAERGVASDCSGKKHSSDNDSSSGSSGGFASWSDFLARGPLGLVLPVRRVLSEVLVDVLFPRAECCEVTVRLVQQALQALQGQEVLDGSEPAESIRPHLRDIFYSLEHDAAARREFELDSQLPDPPPELFPRPRLLVAAGVGRASSGQEGGRAPGQEPQGDDGEGKSSIAIKREEMVDDEHAAAAPATLPPPGQTLAVHVSSTEERRQLLRAQMEFVLTQLRSRPASGPFLAPVDAAEVPDYYDFIAEPMDLGTMAQQLASGAYDQDHGDGDGDGSDALAMFRRHLSLIFSNCRLFNTMPGNEYVQAADELEAHARQLLRSLPAVRVSALLGDAAAAGMDGQTFFRHQHQQRVQALLERARSRSAGADCAAVAMSQGADGDAEVVDVRLQRWLDGTLPPRLQIMADRRLDCALPFGEQRLLVRSVEKMAEYGRLSSGPCGCQGDDDDDAQEDDNDDSGAGAAARAGVGGAGGFLPEHFDPANCLPPHDELNTRLPPPPPSPPPTPPPTPPPNSDRQTLYAHRRAKMRYSQFYNQRRVGVPLALLPPTVYDAVVVANSSACPDIADIRRIARVRQMHRHIAACETGDELSRFLPDDVGLLHATREESDEEEEEEEEGAGGAASGAASGSLAPHLDHYTAQSLLNKSVALGLAHVGFESAHEQAFALLGNAVDAYLLRLGKAVRQASDATFLRDQVSAPGRSPAFMAAAVAVNELAEEGIDGLVSHYRHTQAFSSDLADVEANLQRKYKDVLSGQVPCDTIDIKDNDVALLTGNFGVDIDVDLLQLREEKLADVPVGGWEVPDKLVAQVGNLNMERQYCVGRQRREDVVARFAALRPPQPKRTYEAPPRWPKITSAADQIKLLQNLLTEQLADSKGGIGETKTRMRKRKPSTKGKRGSKSSVAGKDGEGDDMDGGPTPGGGLTPGGLPTPF